MQDIDVVQLAKEINAHYSLSQIKQLCFELGVEFENLDGKIKSDKSRELILEMRRQVRLRELVEKIAVDRPNIANHLYNDLRLHQIPPFFYRFKPYRWLLFLTILSFVILGSLFITFDFLGLNGSETYSKNLESNILLLANSSPCPKIYFLSENSELTVKNHQILDDCASQLNLGESETILRIRGSSAWPSIFPLLTEADVSRIAEERARNVGDYLKLQGVDPDFMIIDTILPPENRRDTNDLTILSQDRFVEFSLESIPKTGR